MALWHYVALWTAAQRPQSLLMYLVKFQGYPDYYDWWIAGKDLEGDSALADYLATHPLSS